MQQEQYAKLTHIYSSTAVSVSILGDVVAAEAAERTTSAAGDDDDKVDAAVLGVSMRCQKKPKTKQTTNRRNKAFTIWWVPGRGGGGPNRRVFLPKSMQYSFCN